MIPEDFLLDFEENLDPSRGRSKYRINVLGYGEISVVFEIPEYAGFAFKRIPNFKSEEEVKGYIELFDYYESLLRNAGMRLLKSHATYVLRKDGKAVLYIVQEKVNPSQVCNKIIHQHEDITQIFIDIIEELEKVWKFNEENQGVEIGIDGQISNWALKDEELHYFDTSTPMVRINGQHQINAEVFLRAAPPVLRTILKKMFLQEILDRYFDFRLVVVDLIANLFKERRSDAIPKLVEIASDYFGERGIEPLTYDEVKKYYDSDASIWSLYLNARKIHRFFTTIAGRRYEYFLPVRIER
jgi:hypothetical protein